MESNSPFSEASPVNEPLSAAERMAEELLLARATELPAVPRSFRRNVLGAATRAEAARQAWKWRLLGMAAAGAILCGTLLRIGVLEARRLQQAQNDLNQSGPVINSFPQSSFPAPADPTPPQPTQPPEIVVPPVDGSIPGSTGPGKPNSSNEAPGNLVDQPASKTAPAKPQPPATPDPAKSDLVPDEVPQPVDPRQGPILGVFEVDTAPLEQAIRQRREKLALLTASPLSPVR
jgi:hypothetical protein